MCVATLFVGLYQCIGRYVCTVFYVLHLFHQAITRLKVEMAFVDWCTLILLKEVLKNEARSISSN